MSELLESAFTMPTTIFSVLMILAAVYWLTVIFGMMDLGILDGIFDMFEGMFGGVAESVGSVVDGALDGAVEGVVDAGDSGIDQGGCLGLAGIPLSIVGSVVVLFAWGFSLGGMKVLSGLAQGTLFLVTVGGLALALSLATTAVALRPLRKVFRLTPVTGRQDLVGRICTVTTLRVDEKFGQAEVEDKGATILIQARSTEANDLTRGSRGLIFQYDVETEVFYITPVDESLADVSESGTD